MNRDSCQKPLMLRMHSFVFSFICVDKQGRVHEEYYEEYYALIQYANHISHYFPLKKNCGMLCSHSHFILKSVK